jgi:hypothetical protein
MNTPLRLSNVEVFSRPFHYIVSPEAFDPQAGQTILAWLESKAPWELVEADFYEQFECSLWDGQLPTRLAFLREDAFVATIKQRIAELFKVDLGHRVDITAHKLVPGQRICLHNDFILGAETHRLLIQLNRGWQDNNGGLLLFFNSADATDIHKIFSTTSYHAVSTIHAGERFTLVYSFYEQKGHG